MRRINSVGGMNRSHRLSQGAKKVTPPSIPGFSNPRGSGSSFGSDLSYSDVQRCAEDVVSSHPMSTFSRAPNGESSTSSSPAFTKLTFEADVIPRRGSNIPKSPGRDSPGDESSASIATVESISSGCRNSTTSLDSGRASNSNSNSTGSNDSNVLPNGITTFHTIHEHRPMISMPPSNLQTSRISVATSGSGGPGSSFRQSYHSSTSSLGSMDRGHEDSICALDITEMLNNGVPDQEVLLAWLTDLHFEDYYDLFASAGYDMPTISKMTPEDLTAIGIKKPNHRKKLKAEIVKLNIPDGLPNYIPPTLDEFLHLVRLMEYRGLLASQGYLSIDDLTTISIEDLEDIGIFRLGHQKRLLLAIKRAKDLKSGRRIAQYPASSASAAAASNFVRVSNKPQMSSFNSLQPQPPPRTPTKLNMGGQSRSLVYQPEVIRIERAPSVTSMVRPPSCSPSPPPPPPPQPASNNEFMPQPMAPLTFQRYQTTAGYPQPPSWVSSAAAASNGQHMRSFDDVDIALSNRNHDRVLMHQHSSSNLTTSGGTLPRLGKGFSVTKQRPVAKIVAKTREQPPSSSMNSLSDYDPKMQMKYESNGGGAAGEFPFANDNVGTIRMRSNSHVSAMMDEGQPSSVEPNDNTDHPSLRQQNQNKFIENGGQRTAGDVLNDIGSMLADLTDELDAMLHMPAAGDATSQA